MLDKQVHGLVEMLWLVDGQPTERCGHRPDQLTSEISAFADMPIAPDPVAIWRIPGGLVRFGDLQDQREQCGYEGSRRRGGRPPQEVFVVASFQHTVAQAEWVGSRRHLCQFPRSSSY